MCFGSLENSVKITGQGAYPNFNGTKSPQKKKRHFDTSQCLQLILFSWLNFLCNTATAESTDRFVDKLVVASDSTPISKDTALPLKTGTLIVSGNNRNKTRTFLALAENSGYILWGSAAPESATFCNTSDCA